MSRARANRSTVPRWLALAAALTLSLALAGCDSCGDWFWQKQPGSCRAVPDPG